MLNQRACESQVEYESSGNQRRRLMMAEDKVINLQKKKLRRRVGLLPSVNKKGCREGLESSFVRTDEGIGNESGN